MNRRSFFEVTIGAIAGLLIPKKAKGDFVIHADQQVRVYGAVLDCRKSSCLNLDKSGRMVRFQYGRIRFSRDSDPDWKLRRVAEDIPPVEPGFVRRGPIITGDLSNREFFWSATDREVF